MKDADLAITGAVERERARIRAGVESLVYSDPRDEYVRAEAIAVIDAAPQEPSC